jgi:hypothetical protein
MPPQTDSETDVLVGLWAIRARRSESAHYQTAAKYSVYHSLLTGATVVLSAITASSLFASHGHNSGVYHVSFGIVGIMAAIVAGLDKGQRYAERSEQHRTAGAAWAVIVNTTEELVLRPSHRPISRHDFDGLSKKMDDTTAHSPQLPQAVFIGNGLEASYLFGRRPDDPNKPRRQHWWSIKATIDPSTEPADAPPVSDPPRARRRSGGQKTPPEG